MPFAHRDWVYLGLLTVLGLCLFMTDLGGRDVWDIDEGMNAAIARTMVLTGDWVTPVFNGEPFLDKPPLSNWMTAVSFRLFGPTEFAARLPVALCGLVCVLVTFLAGRRLHTATTGFLAAVVLATSTYFLVLSRFLQYDVPFTLFTTLAIYCHVSAMRSARPRAFVVGFYAAIACAVLVKGPLGAVIPGLAILTHLAFARDRSWANRLADPMGMVVFGLICIPWYVHMEIHNPGYLYDFIVRQHFANVLGHAAGAAARHPEPVYYYLPAMLAAMFPWSLLLPQSIYRATMDARGRSNEPVLFIVIWILATLLLFSIATSKLSNYLLPILPAAAILVGRYFEQLFEKIHGKRSRSLAPIIGGTAIVMAAFAVYAVTTDSWSTLELRSGIRPVDVEKLVALIAGLFILAFMAVITRRNRAAFGILAIVAPFAVFYVSWAIVPAADAYRGTKEISRQLDRLQVAGEDIHFMGRMPDSALFYANRRATRLRDAQELRAFLASPTRVYALLAPRGRDSTGSFDGDYVVVAVIGNKAIVSNQPDGPQAIESRARPAAVTEQ